MHLEIFSRIIEFKNNAVLLRTDFQTSRMFRYFELVVNLKFPVLYIAALDLTNLPLDLEKAYSDTTANNRLTQL